MRRVFYFVILFTGLQASAQKAGLTFQTSVQGGLLEGERGSAFQLQTINGFKHKTWAAGVGVGLDYYHTRSIPLFLNLRKSFSDNSKTPFLYLSGGYHFPWLKEEDKYWGETKADGGLYMDAGIGYQVSFMKKSALFFSAGYSQKNYSRTETDGIVIAIWPMPAPQSRKFDFDLRRLSIQTGLRF